MKQYKDVSLFQGIKEFKINKRHWLRFQKIDSFVWEVYELGNSICFIYRGMIEIPRINPSCTTLYNAFIKQIIGI